MIDLRNWGATPAEITAAMDSDELFSATTVAVGTRAITIAAAPDRVFDFLAQMGYGRAGWYSYDWIDNLGRTSAFDLHDEWMVRQSGDQVPAGPTSFVAAVVDRPQHIALQVPQRCIGPSCLDFTMGYELRPAGTGTRLICRVRISISGPLGAQLATGLLLADGVMVRKQLLGLQLRCERRP